MGVSNDLDNGVDFTEDFMMNFGEPSKDEIKVKMPLASISAGEHLAYGNAISAKTLDLVDGFSDVTGEVLGAYEGFIRVEFNLNGEEKVLYIAEKNLDLKKIDPDFQPMLSGDLNNVSVNTHQNIEWRKCLNMEGGYFGKVHFTGYIQWEGNESSNIEGEWGIEDAADIEKYMKKCNGRLPTVEEINAMIDSMGKNEFSKLFPDQFNIGYHLDSNYEERKKVNYLGYHTGGPCVYSGNHEKKRVTGIKKPRFIRLVKD